MTAVGRVAAWTAAVLGLASAAVSAYWTAGGTALLDTVGGAIEFAGRGPVRTGAAARPCRGRGEAGRRRPGARPAAPGAPGRPAAGPARRCAADGVGRGQRRAGWGGAHRAARPGPGRRRARPAVARAALGCLVPAL